MPNSDEWKLRLLLASIMATVALMMYLLIHGVLSLLTLGGN